MSEQTIIHRYFSRHQSACETVEVSVGDDAAIVNPPENCKLVISTDTLNVDIHFYADCDSEYIGHKSLAVSLSDIAAMGATPMWATLSLSLPSVDHSWLENFSNGVYSLANQYNLKLVGGDLVKGPLSITVQVIGFIKEQQPLLRSGCQADDLIYVSGYLGDAAMGLNILKKSTQLKLNKSDQEYFIQRLQSPMPRLDVSNKIVKYATAAIDISDGFLLDLQRVLSMSQKAAVIELNNIPVSDPMLKHITDVVDIKNLLVVGEDYELIFTIKPQDKNHLEEYFKTENILVTEVGRVKEGSGISLMNKGLAIELPTTSGYDHFA